MENSGKMNKIKFKKITFNIQLVDGKKKEIDGYLFNIDGLEFDFVVHRSPFINKNWGVSEYLTGASVLRSTEAYTTRKQAVNGAIERLTLPLVDRLGELVNKHKHVNEPLKEAIK